MWETIEAYKNSDEVGSRRRRRHNRNSASGILTDIEKLFEWLRPHIIREQLAAIPDFSHIDKQLAIVNRAVQDFLRQYKVSLWIAGACMW